MLALDALIANCAPQVSPVLMRALVRTESASMPLAIGMDRTQGTVRQPESLSEALATARELAAAGRKFSVGLAQIHVSNVSLYGLTWEQAFDPCQNLAVGQKILWNFYHRATASGYSGVAAIWAALRGYNSGGVDRAISDDYAHRIFAYMSSAPVQVQFGRDGDANAQPTLAAGKGGARSPASLEAKAGDSASRRRPGESLDIFEKSNNKAGF